MVAMVRKDEEQGPADRVPHLPWMRYPVDIDTFSGCPVTLLPRLDPRCTPMLQRCPSDRFNWRLTSFGCCSEATVALFYFAVRKRVGNYSADTFSSLSRS